MTGRGRRGAAALALAGAALAAVWLTAAPATPPLYDGPVVVAPYRFVCIPEGYRQSHPATVRAATVTVTGGVIEGGGVFVTSDEVPLGQIQVLINGEDLAIAAGATSLSVTLTPEPPPAQLPSDGTLAGNVYDVSITSGGSPLALKAGKQWTVVLRAPTGTASAVIEQFTGASWTRLTTQPVGQPDVYAGNSTTFGRFALVVPGTASGPSTCRTFDKFGNPGGVDSTPASAGSAVSSGTGGAGSGDAGGVSPLAIAAVVGGLVVLAGGAFLVRRRSVHS